jgi:hypothetical protein
MRALHPMSALLEFQRAMRVAILGEGPDALRSFLGEHEETPWRLAVYRDTARSTLSQALALTYPAVRRLVGAEFFAGATQAFLSAQLPRSGCLNDYGAQFPELLTAFVLKHAPAADFRYLGDVARLEWAVNRALHAPDRPALALERLASLPPSSLAGVRFEPHPSLSLLYLDHPADTIWRAVLDSDDAAMAAVDLHGGPVHLLVERVGQQVRVQRLDDPAARFTQRVFAGEPLQAALGSDADSDVAPEVVEAQQATLAEHLGLGRFVDFRTD